MHACPASTMAMLDGHERHSQANWMDGRVAYGLVIQSLPAGSHRLDHAAACIYRHHPLVQPIFDVIDSPADLGSYSTSRLHPRKRCKTPRVAPENGKRWMKVRSSHIHLHVAAEQQSDFVHSRTQPALIALKILKTVTKWQVQELNLLSHKLTGLEDVLSIL